MQAKKKSPEVENKYQKDKWAVEEADICWPMLSAAAVFKTELEMENRKRASLK